MYLQVDTHGYASNRKRYEISYDLFKKVHKYLKEEYPEEKIIDGISSWEDLAKLATSGEGKSWLDLLEVLDECEAKLFYDEFEAFDIDLCESVYNVKKDDN